MQEVGGLEVGVARASGRRVFIAVLAAALLGLVTATAAWAAGGLTRPPGTAGCISADKSGGACAVGTVGDSTGIAISPDGKSVYVASYLKNVFSIFDRDPATGALVQKPGAAGCISEDVSGCAEPVGLDEPQEVVVSPDGRNVYAIGEDSSSVAVFNRDSTGALTQPAGTAACISGSGSGGACQKASGLSSPVSLAISPDGRSVYVGGLPSSLVTLARDPQTGTLSRMRGAAGCISIKRLPGCRTTDELTPFGIVVSPDNRNFYVASSNGSRNAVFTFERNPRTGALTPQRGAGQCFTNRTDIYRHCRKVPGLAGSIYGAAISADGRSVYFAGISGEGSLTIFRRNPRSGALTRLRGKATCISASGSRGACQRAAALREASGVSVSPDGKNVYVSGYGRSVLSFDRDAATGALTREQGAAGCLLGSSREKGCGEDEGLSNLGDLVSSPDGRNVYASMLSPGGVSIFDRPSR